MPARSPGFLFPIPPSIRMPLVVRMFTMLLREAGPLHEANPCSQIEQVARFAATETPDPLLVPRGTRAVSYGLQACPPHNPYWRLLSGITLLAFIGPEPDGPPTLLAVATA